MSSDEKKQVLLSSGLLYAHVLLTRWQCIMVRKAVFKGESSAAEHEIPLFGVLNLHHHVCGGGGFVVVSRFQSCLGSIRCFFLGLLPVSLNWCS